MWGRETMAGLAPGRGGDGTRLETEVADGLPVGNRFVGTPAGRRQHLGSTGRDYRVGYGLQVLKTRQPRTSNSGVDAERRETPIFQNPKGRRPRLKNRILGRATVRW